MYPWIHKRIFQYFEHFNARKIHDSKQSIGYNKREKNIITFSIIIFHNSHIWHLSCCKYFSSECYFGMKQSQNLMWIQSIKECHSLCISFHMNSVYSFCFVSVYLHWNNFFLVEKEQKKKKNNSFWWLIGMWFVNLKIPWIYYIENGNQWEDRNVCTGFSSHWGSVFFEFFSFYLIFFSHHCGSLNADSNSERLKLSDV